MGKKLTAEEIQSRLNEYFLQDVKLVSNYKNNKTNIRLHCNECGYEWETRPTQVIYSDYKHSCPNCKIQNTGKTVTCAFCGKEIRRTNSELEKNQSGFYYCSRECGNRHKNMLRKQNGEWNQSLNYRSRAFENLEHKCAVCGWNEDERILEVHHKDEDRTNNDLSNLVILCPTCHRKITLGYYLLTKDYQLINKDNG